MARRNPTKIQYMSDLHLERCNYVLTITPSAPTLLLAGDIDRFCDYDRYRKFLIQQCAQFDRVLLIAGNHEFYGSSRASGLENAERLVQDPDMSGKLHYLNRGRHDIDANVTVLGCTLHSHIAPDYTALTNDFARIEGWRVAMHNDEHQKDLTWLQSTLREIQETEPQRTIIIATHYAPTFERVCHPLHEYNNLSQCFSSHALDTTCRKGLLKSVSHWVFGHTHWNANLKIGKIRVLSNQCMNDHVNLNWWQRKWLYRDFDPEAVIEISAKAAG